MHERAESSYQLRCQIDQFRSDWRHCARSSDFLAESAEDEPYLRNLLSSALNELFELVFKLGSGPEQASLQVTRRAEVVEMMLSLPLASLDEPKVLADLERLIGHDPRNHYLDQLGSDLLSPLFGLLPLICDFGASVQARVEDGVLRLSMRLPVGQS